MNIESQYRELIKSGQINPEFADLYAVIDHQRLRDILTGLHYNYVSLFRTMNERLPTNENGAHFWADPSRQLINSIEITIGLYNALKNTKHSFEIDDYYFDLIMKCRDFFSTSGGNLLPTNMAKVDLYYTMPIFKSASTISVNNTTNDFAFSLKLIGGGSYANVYKYKDSFYNRTFVLKRAKKELSEIVEGGGIKEFDVDLCFMMVEKIGVLKDNIIVGMLDRTSNIKFNRGE